MKKCGFTLIELLAVITILSIIMIISIPIFLYLIEDAKNSSKKNSIKLYLKAVDNSIANQKVIDPNFEPKQCIVKENKTIECDNFELVVDLKGSAPTSGIIIINDDKISFKNLLLEGKYYHQIQEQMLKTTNESINSICTPKKGIVSLALGTEYECEVKENTKFNFFVLSDDGNNVNLIMDSNICLDGTNIYTNENNYCRYAWYDVETSNAYGPITSMTTLYEATKEWNKVQNIIFEYKDEENKYGGIKVTDDKMEIIPKNGTSYIKYFDLGKPLRARLPKYSELLSTGCKISSESEDDYSGYGSCPVWMMKNIRYKDITDYLGYDKYEQNKEPLLNKVEKISGYWQLSSSIGGGNAYSIMHKGYISRGSGITANQSFGIRPVITIPKYNLIN